MNQIGDDEQRMFPGLFAGISSDDPDAIGRALARAWLVAGLKDDRLGAFLDWLEQSVTRQAGDRHLCRDTARQVGAVVRQAALGEQRRLRNAMPGDAVPAS